VLVEAAVLVGAAALVEAVVLGERERFPVSCHRVRRTHISHFCHSRMAAPRRLPDQDRGNLSVFLFLLTFLLSRHRVFLFYTPVLMI